MRWSKSGCLAVKIVKVFSSVSITLYHCRHINLVKLCLEVIKTKDRLLESLPRDGEAVLLGVNVRHCTMISYKMFARWCHP